MKVFLDNTPARWSYQKEIWNYAEKLGLELVGVTSHPMSKMDMFLFKDKDLSKLDRDNLVHVRYMTATTVVSGQCPAIQLDMTTGKIHFLSKIGMATDSFIFDRRGAKIEYLRKLPNF